MDARTRRSAGSADADAVRVEFDRKLLNWFAGPEIVVPKSWKIQADKLKPMDFSQRFFASKYFTSGDETAGKSEMIEVDTIDPNKDKEETMYYSFAESDDDEDGGEKTNVWYNGSKSEDAEDDEMDLDVPQTGSQQRTPSPTAGELLINYERNSTPTKKRSHEHASEFCTTDNKDKKRRLSSALSKILDCENDVSTSIRGLSSIVNAVRGENQMFNSTITDPYVDDQQWHAEEEERQGQLRTWLLERQPLTLLEISHLAEAIFATTNNSQQMAG